MFVSTKQSEQCLKGHGNEWGGFSGVFAEIGSSWVPCTTFRAVQIFASNLRRYSYSKNDYHRHGESLTPHITDTRSHRLTDTRSRRLPASLIRGVGDSPHHQYVESAIEFFKRKLSVSMIRRVVDSPHQWYRKSLTPRIVELESRRLCVSLIRRVADSLYHWVGELTTPHIGDTGSRYLKKNYFSFDSQYFKRLKHAIKGSFWPKISQGCNLLSKLKVWK